MIHRIFRTSLALIAGLFAISMFVESLEFVIVALANGSVTTDPEVYLAIRNQTWILITKLIYNAVGAVAGGYITARLAGYAHRNSSIMAENTSKTHANRWLVCSGLALILVSALCVLTTIYGMEMSFHSIADSSATARPSELANGISLAMKPSYAAWPVGILGMVLLVLGFTVRRPTVRS